MVAAAGALEMTGGQRVELERLARSHTAPTREVRQAKALLWAADGVSNAEIARRCVSTPKSVRRWRSRFAAEGTAAVGRIRTGRGRPVVLGDEGGARRAEGSVLQDISTSCAQYVRDMYAIRTRKMRFTL